MTDNTSTELLTKEDIEFISFRNALIRYIEPKNIINKIKDIILDSKIFQFSSERTMKFFTEKDTTFILTFDREKMEKEFPCSYKFKGIEDETEWINNNLHHELFVPLGDFIISNITEFIKSNEYDLSKEFISDLRTFSTMYASVVNVNDNKISIRYVLL